MGRQVIGKSVSTERCTQKDTDMNSLVLTFAATFILKDVLAGDSRLKDAGRLKRDLFRDYEKDIIPQMKTDKPVDVAAGLSMYHMEFTDEGELDFTAWARLKWMDERLKWDPKEYGDINVIRVPANDVWIPDVEIYNSLEYGPGYFSSQMSERIQLALIYPNGEVLFIPPIHGKVSCNEKEFENWPWGDYDCSIKMGSWTYDGHMFNLTKYNNQNYIEVEESNESNLIFTEDSFKEEAREVKYYDCCDEPYISINYKFKLQKKFKLTDGGAEKNPNLKPEYKPT